MIYKKRQAGGPMPPQGMEGQMMPPNPQEQMAPPQGPPQGGEGAPPTQLPPELQQILMSLPENVKKYILSLPVEQQIVELQKVAQGQMQATQNSPNQMMQQQMNTPPQGQPQEQMPMGKYGGKFQTGGYKGTVTKKNNDINSWMGRMDSMRNANLNNRKNLPNTIQVNPGESYQDALKRKAKEGIRPIPNYNPNTPPKRVYLAKGGDSNLNAYPIPGNVSMSRAKPVLPANPNRMGWDKTKQFFDKKSLDQFSQSNPNVVPQPPVVQPTTQQVPDQNIIIDKQPAILRTNPDGTKTIIKGGNTQAFNQAKTYTPNAGDVNVTQVNSNASLAQGNTSTSKYTTPTANPNTVAANPNTTQSNRVTSRPKVTAKPSTNTGDTYSGSNNMNTAPTSQSNKPSNTYDRQYTPSDTYLNEQIAKSKSQKQLVDPQSANPNLPQNAPKVIVSQNTRDKSSKHYENRINSALQSLQNADQTASNYERMLQAGQLPDRNIAQKKLKEFQRQKQIAYDNYNKLLQDYETMQQYEVKQYGGKLYRSGGNTKLQYSSSARINEDELDPLYKDYMQNVRGSGINQRQVDKSQKRYDRFDRREKRRTDGTFLDRWAKQRRNKQAGKIAMNENQRDVDAFNAQAAANDIGTVSGYPMRPITAPNVAPKPTVTTPQSLRNNPSSVVTPNSAKTNTVAPRVTTSPNSGGKRGLSPFEQAFADARKSHGGPGGIFEWNGKKYTTDYKEEVGKGRGNSGGGNSGGSVTAPVTSQPTEPQNQQPKGPREQSWLEKEAREGAGVFGRGLMKAAEWLDPGSWAASGLKKLGMADKWADRVGTGVSIGSMFIPGLGIAGMVGKAGKLAGVASKGLVNAEKVAKTALAAKKVASNPAAIATLASRPDVLSKVAKVMRGPQSIAVKTAEKNKILQRAFEKTFAPGERAALASATKARRAGELVTYGPKFGETGNKIAVGAGNMLKKGINVAPGAYQIGAAGDAVSQGNDKEAIARGILGAGMGAIGVKKWRGVNKSKIEREAQSNFRIIDGKEHVLTKNGMWKPTVPANAASNSAEAAALKARGAKNLVPVSNSPGTYMDSVGNLFDKAGNWIGKAGTGIKNTGKSVASKFRRTPPATGAWSPVTPSPGGTTITVPKYGGQIYKNGGKILKSGGKMKYNTCKYGC